MALCVCSVDLKVEQIPFHKDERGLLFHFFRSFFFDFSFNVCARKISPLCGGRKKRHLKRGPIKGRVSGRFNCVYCLIYTHILIPPSDNYGKLLLLSINEYSVVLLLSEQL